MTDSSSSRGGTCANTKTNPADYDTGCQITAVTVSYNNAGSTLSAVNVQQAVDQLDGKFSAQNDHNNLDGRSEVDCHPIGATTGLQSALDSNTTLITDHTADLANPHQVTPAQIGAANVIHTHSEYVEKAGDTMTGALVLPGNAVNPLEAIPLQQMGLTSGYEIFVPSGNITPSSSHFSMDGRSPLYYWIDAGNHTVTVDLAANMGFKTGEVITFVTGAAGNITIASGGGATAFPSSGKSGTSNGQMCFISMVVVVDSLFGVYGDLADV